VVSKVLISKNKEIKKKKSPTCEIKKTFIAAFKVLIRIDQYCTKKKDTILIHSQRQIILKRSYVQKNMKANCENSDDINIMF
jgi:hypothetical protein